MSWKCMWDALEFPVLPSLAMTWPFLTLSPGLTRRVPFFRWA